jgi:hypothetical protein
MRRVEQRCLGLYKRKRLDDGDRGPCNTELYLDLFVLK